MYCGGKNYSPSSSPSSMISRVFPVSWFPKPKPRGTAPETNSPRTEHGPKLPAVERDARLNSMDDEDEEAYWRLSFRTDDKKSIGGIPVSNSDAESHFQVPSFTSREAEDRQYKDRILRIHEHRRSRMKQMERGRGDDEKSKLVEKDIFPIETEVYISRNFSLSSVDEDYSFGRVSNSEWQSSDKMNVETDYRMQPIYRTSNRSHQRRIRPKSNSPNREFRVRVLEEMKKEKIRSNKKETKEPVMEGATIYDSFAEVKNSFDPQRDFRDSMVEMICEKGIRRREELEDLLACYLTLNRDEYHDLIIQVFQQVWFDLSGY